MDHERPTDELAEYLLACRNGGQWLVILFVVGSFLWVLFLFTFSALSWLWSVLIPVGLFTLFLGAPLYMLWCAVRWLLTRD